MKNMIVPVVMLLSLSARGDSPWAGEFSLGGLFTGGNSESAQFDSGLSVSRWLAGPELTGIIQGEASYGRQNEQTYREKYGTSGTVRWDFSPVDFTNLKGYWARDEFAGVDRELGVSLGYGRRLGTGEQFSASVETGAGLLSRRDVEDSILETSTWYTGLDLAWQASAVFGVTENSVFQGDFNEADNYTFQSTLEAVSTITGNLAFLLGYDLTYRNIPPMEGGESTDTALRAQLRLAI